MCLGKECLCKSLSLFRNPSLLKQLWWQVFVLLQHCACLSMAQVSLRGLQSVSCCWSWASVFHMFSALIKCYTIMSMNQRQARGHIKAFSCSVFSLPEVKSYVVLSMQQLPTSCQSLLDTAKYSFRFISGFFFFSLCFQDNNYKSICICVHIFYLAIPVTEKKTSFFHQRRNSPTDLEVIWIMN